MISNRLLGMIGVGVSAVAIALTAMLSGLIMNLSAGTLNPYNSPVSFYNNYKVYPVHLTDALFNLDGSVNAAVAQNLIDVLDDPFFTPLMTPKTHWGEKNRPTTLTYNGDSYVETTVAEFSEFVAKKTNVNGTGNYTGAQAGAVIIKLFETSGVPNFTTSSTIDQRVHAFTDQWFQLVYRAQDNGDDVLTFWMMNSYRQSVFNGNYFPSTAAAGENYRLSGATLLPIPTRNNNNNIQDDNGSTTYVADDGSTKYYSFEGNYSASIARTNLQNDFAHLKQNYFQQLDNFIVKPSGLPGKWQAAVFQTGTNLDNVYYIPGQFNTGGSFGGSSNSNTGYGAACWTFAPVANSFHISNGLDDQNAGTQSATSWRHSLVQDAYSDEIWLPSLFEVRGMGYNKEVTRSGSWVSDPGNPNSGLEYESGGNSYGTQQIPADTNTPRVGLWRISAYEETSVDSYQSSVNVWTRGSESNIIGISGNIGGGEAYSHKVTDLGWIRPALHLSVKAIRDAINPITSSAANMRLASGYWHTLMINGDGQLLTWGGNNYGQCGQGTTGSGDGTNNGYSTPTLVQNPAGVTGWKEIGAGRRSSAAIATNGELYTWGQSDSGQLGRIVDGSNPANKPGKVGSATNWKSVAVAGVFMLAINENGELYSWGTETNALGLGSTTTAATPQRVDPSGPANWNMVAAGHSPDGGHTIAIRADGQLWTWGFGGSGRLGLGNSNNYNTPQRVMGFNDCAYVEVDLASSWMITKTGEMYAWGSMGGHGLGYNAPHSQGTPQPTGNGANNWLAVSHGDDSYFVMAINNAGEMFSAGMDSAGCLGLGGDGDKKYLTKITTPPNYWRITSTGSDFACAIDSNGDLYTWGKNSVSIWGAHSQLGQGFGAIDKDIPTLVGNYGPSMSIVTPATIASSLGASGGVGASPASVQTQSASLTATTTLVFNAGAGYRFDKTAAASLKIESNNIGTDIYDNYGAMTGASGGGWKTVGVVKYRAWYDGGNIQLVQIEIEVLDHTQFPSSNPLQVIATPSLRAYTINYNNLLHGSSAPAKTTYTVAELPLALQNPGGPYTGHTFGGWLDGGSTGSPITQLLAGRTGDVTLWATWNPIQYTVTFDLNGQGATGNPTTVAQTINHGGTVTKPGTDPTRTGYAFGGWFKEAGCTNAWTFGSGGDTVTATTSIFAKWTANKYDVAFNGNGSNGGTAMSSQEHEYDKSLALTSNTYTQSYTVTFDYNGGTGPHATLTSTYTFAEWNTQSNGQGTAYTNSQTVSNLSSVNGAIVNLHAQWTPVPITLPTPTTVPAGPPTYTFVGWYDALSGGNMVGNAGDLYQLTSSTPNPLFARWEENSHTVIFQSKGVTLTEFTRYVGYGQKTTAPTPSPTSIDGSEVFDGWFKDSGYQDQWNFAVDTVTGDTTLYARWIPAVHAVTFDLQGGVGNGTTVPQNIQHGLFASKPGTNPTKEGYIFENWYLVAEPQQGVDSAFVFATAQILEPLTLFANWTLNSNKFTFNFNGSQANVDYMIPFGVDIWSIADNTFKQGPGGPTHARHTFEGWYVDNGYEQGVNWGALYNFNNPMPDKVVVVHARWKPIPDDLDNKIAAAKNKALPADKDWYIKSWYDFLWATIDDAIYTRNNPNASIHDFDTAISLLDAAMEGNKWDTRLIDELMAKPVNQLKVTTDSYRNWIEKCNDAKAYLSLGAQMFEIDHLWYHYLQLHTAFEALAPNFDGSVPNVATDKEELFKWIKRLESKKMEDGEDDYIFVPENSDFDTIEELIEMIEGHINNKYLTNDGMEDAIKDIIKNLTINKELFMKKRNLIWSSVTNKETGEDYYTAETWTNLISADEEFYALINGSNATVQGLYDALGKIEATRDALKLKERANVSNLGYIVGAGVLILGLIVIVMLSRRGRKKEA